jgi:hypothetical protein
MAGILSWIMQRAWETIRADLDSRNPKRTRLEKWECPELYNKVKSGANLPSLELI